MEQHITAERIANSIMQEDKIEGGVYLLVEGVKDIKIYSRLIDEKNVRIKQTYGKYKQRDVYKILSERGYNSKICIRDADFLRVSGNVKYSHDFTDDIFATDCHDSEIMMISSDALKNILVITTNPEKTNAFELQSKCTIRELVFELAKPIGYLRYASKKHNLGLSFKPEKPDGKKLKYKKFICERELKTLSDDVMINTIYEYSRGREANLPSREHIKEKLIEVYNLNIPAFELINGHDVSEILSIVISKGLKSDSSLIQDQESVESSLALAYELRHFQETQLYLKITEWSEKNRISVIRN